MSLSSAWLVQPSQCVVNSASFPSNNSKPSLINVSAFFIFFIKRKGVVSAL